MHFAFVLWPRPCTFLLPRSYAYSINFYNYKAKIGKKIIRFLSYSNEKLMGKV
jgi:hypothetical protein